MQRRKAAIMIAAHLVDTTGAANKTLCAMAQSSPEADWPKPCHDVIVAGAGPAGILTAVLLTRLGRKVLLLAAGRSRPRIEGLSQRVVDVLQAQGLDHALKAVGPAVTREVLWNGEGGGRNREYVTDREVFDAALLGDCRAAGVETRTFSRLSVSKGKDSVLVAYRDSDHGDDATTRIFVEARGRRAPLSRARQRRGPETTAIMRQIVGGDGRAGTALESFQDGWAWYVCDGTKAFLQVFFDSSGGLPKRAQLLPRFDQALAELPLLSGFLAGGCARGAAMTRNATPYLAAQLLGSTTIRIGDAALAVDPLSGHGLFEALGSALAATAVINTLLATPERAALARRFYEERAQMAFLRYCRTGRDFYALESRWRDREFWRTRAAWPDQEPAHAGVGLGRLTVVRRPVVENGLIVERRVVVTPDQPRGIWRIDGVPLPELIDLLQAHEGQSLAASLPEAARRLATAEAELATALDWLRARGLLAGGETIRLRAEALETSEAETL